MIRDGVLTDVMMDVQIPILELMHISIHLFDTQHTGNEGIVTPCLSGLIFFTENIG
jgi:hypothetical protein